MQALLALQSQVDTQLTILAPYSQLLSWREYFNAASPTDFRKSMSAMGGDSTGWTVPAAQSLGALAVRKTCDRSHDFGVQEAAKELGQFAVLKQCQVGCRC